MAQIPTWLYSSFKELSNNTSHAQIGVPMKKLCHQQVGDENKSFSRFLSRQSFVATKLDFVTTELAKNSITTNLGFVATNLGFVATKLATNSVATKLFVETKPDFVAKKPMTKLCCNKTQIL